MFAIGLGDLKSKYINESKPKFLKYAEHHSIPFISIEDVPEGFDKSRKFHWVKIFTILKLLNSGYNVYYLDCDMFICNFEKLFKTSKDIGICRDSAGHLNTGLLHINNTEFSKQFFQKIWNRNNPTKHAWEDNLAFIQEYDLLSQEEKNNHIEMYDKVLVNESKEIYIRHFAGKQPWNKKYL